MCSWGSLIFVGFVRVPASFLGVGMVLLLLYRDGGVQVPCAVLRDCRRGSYRCVIGSATMQYLVLAVYLPH